MAEGELFRLPRTFIRRALLVMGAYCALHLAVRLMVSPTLGYDDAEQVLWSQHLSPNYGPANLPLYTWMVWGVSQLTGPGVLPTAIVRYVLMLAMYAAIVLVCAMLFGQKRQLVYAVAGYLLMYQFGLYAHHDLTHSALASTAVAWTLVGLLLVERLRTRWAYAVLGLAISVGLLSKHNYLVFLAGLFAAALIVPQYRAALIDRRTVRALILVGIACLPYCASLVTSDVHAKEVAEVLVGSDDVREPVNRVLAIPRAIGAVVSYTSPLWAILLAVFPQLYSRDRLTRPRGPHRRLLGIQMLASVAAMAVSAVVLFADGFKARWMSAALMLFPLYMVGGLEKEDSRPRAERAYMAFALAVTLAVVGVRLVDDRLEPRSGGMCRKTLPVYLLQDSIRQMGFADGELVGDSNHLAGNLAAVFPGATVYSAFPGKGPALYPPAEHRCLYVWRGPPTPVPDVISSHMQATGHRLADTEDVRRAITVPYPQCPDCSAQFTLWAADPSAMPVAASAEGSVGPLSPARGYCASIAVPSAPHTPTASPSK